MTDVELETLNNVLKGINFEEIEDIVGFDLMMSKPLLNQLTESEKVMLYEKYVESNKDDISR